MKYLSSVKFYVLVNLHNFFLPITKQIEQFWMLNLTNYWFSSLLVQKPENTNPLNWFVFDICYIIVFSPRKRNIYYQRITAVANVYVLNLPAMGNAFSDWRFWIFRMQSYCGTIADCMKCFKINGTIFVYSESVVPILWVWILAGVPFLQQNKNSISHLVEICCLNLSWHLYHVFIFITFQQLILMSLDPKWHFALVFLAMIFISETRVESL